jgi:hypothetical protein
MRGYLANVVRRASGLSPAATASGDPVGVPVPRRAGAFDVPRPAGPARGAGPPQEPASADGDATEGEAGRSGPVRAVRAQQTRARGDVAPGGVPAHRANPDRASNGSAGGEHEVPSARAATDPPVRAPAGPPGGERPRTPAAAALPRAARTEEATGPPHPGAKPTASVAVRTSSRPLHDEPPGAVPKPEQAAAALEGPTAPAPAVTLAPSSVRRIETQVRAMAAPRAVLVPSPAAPAAGDRGRSVSDAVPTRIEVRIGRVEVRAPVSPARRPRTPAPVGKGFERLSLSRRHLDRSWW